MSIPRLSRGIYRKIPDHLPAQAGVRNDKKNMKKLFGYITIFAFAVYMLILFYSNKLTYYIHPRFLDFSYIASIISLFVAVSGVIKVIEANSYSQVKWKQMRVFAPLVVVLLLGFLLPVKPLSSATAAQRSIDLNSISQSEISTLDMFTRDSKSFTLGDWVLMQSANPDYNEFVGQEVDVIGFIFDSQNSSEQFMLAKFLITCCAVDARPVGINVNYAWKNEYEQDDWVRVTGVFAEDNGQLYIEPYDIYEISVPDNPYLY